MGSLLHMKPNSCVSLLSIRCVMLDLVEVEYFPVHTTQCLSSDQNVGVQSL